MSDLFEEANPPQKNLQNCPKCDAKIIQDIFSIQYNRKKKRAEPGLMEARACFKCNIIYEVIE